MSFNFIPGKTIELPDINYKSKIELEPNRSALIIVDMQNDFVKEGGSLLVEAAKDTVDNIKSIINKARQNNVKVVYTQDTHFKNDKEWEIWPKHCEKNSWGWHIIDEIKPAKDDMVFEKNRYDGFYGTNLDHYLKHVWNIKDLVIMGTVSNICVAQTAASAGLRWYNIITPADCISANTEFDQAMTLRQISTLYAGSVVKSVNDIRFK